MSFVEVVPIVQNEQDREVNNSEDNFTGDIYRNVYHVVLQHAGHPEGDDEPDGCSRHDLVTECVAEVEHLSLLDNPLFIFRIKVL